MSLFSLPELRADLELALRMEELKAHFEASARRGVLLSTNQLAAYAQKKNLSVPRQELKKMRSFFKFTAYAEPHRRPLRYMTSSISKYGLWQVDLANFEPQHKIANKNCTAFIVMVEGLSGQTFAVPVASKKTTAWFGALVTLLDTRVNSCVAIFSDRDVAVKNEDWRKMVRDRWGCSWYFLKNRLKCFDAEGRIG